MRKFFLGQTHSQHCVQFVELLAKTLSDALLFEDIIFSEAQPNDGTGLNEFHF